VPVVVENTTLFIASECGAERFKTHQTDSRTGIDPDGLMAPRRTGSTEATLAVYV